MKWFKKKREQIAQEFTDDAIKHLKSKKPKIDMEKAIALVPVVLIFADVVTSQLTVTTHTVLTGSSNFTCYVETVNVIVQ